MSEHEASSKMSIDEASILKSNLLEGGMEQKYETEFDAKIIEQTEFFK